MEREITKCLLFPCYDYLLLAFIIRQVHESNQTHLFVFEEQEKLARLNSKITTFFINDKAVK